MANNTITAPKGFLAAGVQCGIKKSGKADLGLLVCPTGANAAAVFTTNKIVSAAVAVSKQHIKSPKIRAVVVNSGNANTCTGQKGLRNARQMCAETAYSLNAIRDTQYAIRDIFVASTGIIGRQLPIKKITAGISKAATKLSASASAGLDFAKAIMTTDTKPAKALGQLCDDLAKQMALDAEGATRMFKVVVKGASTKADAARASRAIADYPLVKCAVNGGDPNWGRIICAVGSAGVRLNPNKLSCKLGPITVFNNGAPRKFDVKKASKIVSQTEHTITVDLGAGKASDFCYGCDLSKDYVTINADYQT